MSPDSIYRKSEKITERGVGSCVIYYIKPGTIEKALSWCNRSCICGKRKLQDTQVKIRICLSKRRSSRGNQWLKKWTCFCLFNNPSWI